MSPRISRPVPDIRQARKLARLSTGAGEERRFAHKLPLSETHHYASYIRNRKNTEIPNLPLPSFFGGARLKSKESPG